MMKIDFIKNGNPDCPILRIYGNREMDYESLINAIKEIINKKKYPVEITALKNFESQIKLNFVLNDFDRGVLSSDYKNFTCELTENTWRDIVEKLIALKNLNASGYQWLNESSDISLLVSTDGKW